jgi:conjugative transfer signal peptidase TraF
VLALAVAGGASVASRIGFGLNLSGSAPRGLYRAVPGIPTRGALVVTCLPSDVGSFGRLRGYLGSGDCPGDAQPVLKRVVAVAGDTVSIDGLGVAVNGTPVTSRPIHEHDHAGRPLPHRPFGLHRVAEGDLWVLGVSLAPSWDSRYFGSVPVSGVRGIARPVLTLGEARP